jgi:hypothetical protein
MVLAPAFDTAEHHSMVIIKKAAIILIIFTAVSLLTVLACRVLSLRVHATSLLVRLKVSTRRCLLLHRLPDDAVWRLKTSCSALAS